jgi:hypothetical protein
VPTLALHGIHGESARNYHLIDEESTEGREIPPGITSSYTRNPPEEGDSTGNYQLIYSDSGPVRSKFAENPSNGNNYRISSSKSYILTIPTFLKFKIRRPLLN